MTKTIEEAAREYAAKLNYSMEAKHNMCPQDFEIAFCDGANYVFNLPLASRLTAEEKERVRKMYAEELGMAQHFHSKAKASNDLSCKKHYFELREPYISRMKLLERIFGADFFNEEE